MPSGDAIPPMHHASQASRHRVAVPDVLVVGHMDAGSRLSPPALALIELGRVEESSHHLPLKTPQPSLDTSHCYRCVSFAVCTTV